jgi:hypothetical protein
MLDGLHINYGQTSFSSVSLSPFLLSSFLKKIFFLKRERANTAAYDVFDLSWFKEPVQCAAGLCSAVISTSKIYDQYWLASANAAAKSVT